jgi:hypothetical protein
MKNKNKPGSILAYSLIIISIMIAIVATMSIATVISKKSASSTDASVQAYQTADSGVQLTIKEIDNNLGATISSVFSDCTNGVISDQSYGSLNGTYTISFYSDEAGSTLMDCSDQVKDIRSIKSVGTYNGTVRAVNVAVAAGGASIDYTQCYNQSVTLSTSYTSCNDGYVLVGMNFSRSAVWWPIENFRCCLLK